MSQLLIPKHYQKPGAPAPKRNSVHVIDTDDFVTPAQIAEQLAAFNTYTGTVPTAAGWNILILVVAMPDVTEGGFIMEDMYREQKTKASPQGIVLGIGKGAYNRADPRFPDGAWCQKGDRVLFGRYTGKAFRLSNGQELAFLVDTDIIAVVDRWDIASAGSGEKEQAHVAL